MTLLVLMLLAVLGKAIEVWLGRTSPLEGQARVIDGDTFDLCQGGRCTRIRVCGINTPEREEAGYRDARQALRTLVATDRVRCVAVGDGTVCDGRSKRQSHDRVVAQCHTASGIDIAEHMLRKGLACELTGFTRGYYGRSFATRPCASKE